MKKNLFKVLLLFVVAAAVSLQSCVKDDYSIDLENELQAVQKDVKTLEELFQLQLDDFAKRIEDVQAAWNEVKTRYQHNPVDPGGDQIDLGSLNDELERMAEAITALENIVSHADTGLVSQLASLKQALYNAVGAGDDAELYTELKRAYDRAIELSDEYIEDLIADFLSTYKVTEANLDKINWADIINNQWFDNNGYDDDGLGLRQLLSR